MIRVESSVVINRPIEEVGRFLGEIERMRDWTDMSVSRQLTEGPVRPGTRAEAAIGLGPLQLGWTWEVVAFDPRAGLTYRTISSSPLGMDGNVQLAAEGPGATRVDAVVEVRMRGLLRLLEPLVRGEVTRGEKAELVRLKALLESRGEPATKAAATA